MSLQTMRIGRLTDGQVAGLVRQVMERWPTNPPIVAVGGFSYSHADADWDRSIRDRDTFGVSSASVSEMHGAFTFYFRRGAGGADEVGLYSRDREDDAPGPSLGRLLSGLGLLAAP